MRRHSVAPFMLAAIFCASCGGGSKSAPPPEQVASAEQAPAAAEAQVQPEAMPPPATPVETGAPGGTTGAGTGTEGTGTSGATDTVAEGAAKDVSGAASEAGKAVEGAAEDTGKTVQGAAEDTGKAVAGAAEGAEKAVTGESEKQPVSGTTTGEKQPATGTEAPAPTEPSMTLGDGQILAILGQANRNEMALAKIGQDHGSKKVKKLANTLSKDHGKAIETLRSSAVKLNIGPTDSAESVAMRTASDQELEKLRAMSPGPEFDSAFVAQVIAEHEKQLDLLDNKISPVVQKDFPKLGNVVITTRDKIQGHLELAQKLQGSAEPKPEAQPKPE